MLFVSSLPVWLAEAGVYLIVAYSFNLDAHFTSFWFLALAVVLVTVTSNLITAIPASIGGIGAFEVVAQQTLVGLGIGAAAAASYSVAVHLLALWLPVKRGGHCAVAVAQRVATRVGVAAGRAGTTKRNRTRLQGVVRWIPAFAEMTVWTVGWTGVCGRRRMTRRCG